MSGLPPEAVEFFWTFARFEYAMKCAGLARSAHRKRPQGSEAQPEDWYIVLKWEELAERLGPRFWDAVREPGKIDNLLSLPPQVQLVADGGLDWLKATPPKDTLTLMFAVKRVRNNLFHGGKFTGYEEDSSRNLDLLREGKWVLEMAANALLDLEGPFVDRA